MTDYPSSNPNIPTAKWLRLLIILSTSLLLLLTVGVLVKLLTYIGHTLLIFALGGLVAYALSPLVEVVRGGTGRRSRPRWVGVLVVFLSLFTILAVSVAVLGTAMAHQAETLVQNHALYEREGRQLVERTDTLLNARGIHVHLLNYLDHPPENVKNWSKEAAQKSLTFAQHFSASLMESVIVLLIALYFLIYSEELREKVNAQLPLNVLPHAQQWQTDINRILGGFVRGQLLLALVMGVAAGLGCALLGVSFWLLVGAVVAITSLIPVFGPYIGAVPAVIAAALTPGGQVLTPGLRVVLVIVLFFVINEAGSKILYPRLVGSALGLHEVMMLFVLFAGLEVGGIWGVLFAAPLMAMVLVSIPALYRMWHGEPPVSLSQTAAREAEQET